MEEKKQLGEKLGEFFAGKGFYIVLLLCAGLIATSIWLMADRSGADVEPTGKTNAGTASVSSDELPSLPAMKVVEDPTVPTEAPRRPTTGKLPIAAEHMIILNLLGKWRIFRSLPFSRINMLKSIRTSFRL